MTGVPAESCRNFLQFHEVLRVWTNGGSRNDMKYLELAVIWHELCLSSV
jgi:hypothetical protein